MARSLVVALGEVGGEDAIAALAARVEAPAAGEEGLVTRLMALESQARAQVRTGGLAQVGDLHHRLAGMVADRSLDPRQRMLAPPGLVEVKTDPDRKDTPLSRRTESFVSRSGRGRARGSPCTVAGSAFIVPQGVAGVGRLSVVERQRARSAS